MMKKLILLALITVSASMMAVEPMTYRQKMAFDRAVILESMYRAKEWQEAQHDGPVPTNWLTGTLYTGVYACYEATERTEFLDAARDWCIAADWTCGENRPQHADDICSAQTFLDVYSADRDESQIAGIKELIETYYFGMDEVTKKLIKHASWPEESRPFTGRNLWWWCDALYMAPPVLARLGAHTGEQKYYDLLHELYWDCTDYLYNPEENLFYRDNRYFDAKTPNGLPVFWGRGNGWVVAGLVRTLDYLQEDDPMRERYLELFRDMMLRLAALQHEDDGAWSSSVNDPAWLPEPESSSSSFFTYALAAGINRGWLDAQTYLPHLVKGWEGLLNCLRGDGKLEWAQLVDGAPKRVRHEDMKNYAQGAFLLAASEVYKMNLDPEKYSETMGTRRVVHIAPDAAWTWYNDERAIFWEKHLISGYVKQNGKSAYSVYLLPGKNHEQRLQHYELSSWNERDDHNNPAFLDLGPDSLLAVYAMHNTAKEFNTRMIDGNFRHGEEQSIAHSSKVTYSNLYSLEAEGGKIYNFFRGEGWNPNMVCSEDRGSTWSDPIMLFLSGGNSTRPYVKYASNGKERIDLFYTDGHPRNEPENNIYHVFYEDGAIHNSRGKKIRSLEKIKEAPLVPGDGTVIYEGSGPLGRGWVHDFEYGEKGSLAGVFISSADGDEGLDLRYHYARFDPGKKKWTSNEVGYAGPHLYVPENHYAGGICIDPDDISVIWLSSTLDPRSGEDNGTGHFQIYRGETADGGITWEFEQVTHDVRRDNLRPIVPRGRPEGMEECVLWFRGDYRRYEDFDCEVVGIVPSKEKRPE